MTKRWGIGRRGSSRSRGIALIIVLSVLFIMAMLATTLVTMHGIEMEISRSFRTDVAARLVAESGIHDAIARLHEMIVGGRFAASGAPADRRWIYYGDTEDEERNAPNDAVPIEDAVNPSFAVEEEATQNPTDASAKPRTIAVNGRRVGYSGAMERSTFAAGGDIYSIRIADLSGRIYVNDGLGHAYNTRVLKNILNNLGLQPSVNIIGLGDRLIAGRPSTGYADMTQIARKFTPQEYARFKNFITIHAWTDRNVVNPVPLSPQAASFYPWELVGSRPTADPAVPRNDTCLDASGRIFRYGRGKNWKDQWVGGQKQPTALLFFTGGNYAESSIYGWDELNPCYIEITSRAPVNVNTAPAEVLAALLAGIEGFFVMDFRSMVDGDYAHMGYHRMRTFDLIVGKKNKNNDPEMTVDSEIGVVCRTQPVTSGMAVAVANAIVVNRNKQPSDVKKPFEGPFVSWAQFNLFIDDLVARGVIADGSKRFTGMFAAVAGRAIGDAIKANANPNLHLNEINPNRNISLLVDKTDLIRHSTEFCFVGGGYFEVESLGRIMKPTSPAANVSTDWETAASVKVSTVVKLYDLLRQTTQKDFSAGKMLAEGIGEDGCGLPDIAAAMPWRTNNNLPLETVPEIDCGPAPGVNEYEGCVQLATIGGSMPLGGAGGRRCHKPKDVVFRSTQSRSLAGERMRAHYTFDVDLDYAYAAEAGDASRRCALTRTKNLGITAIGGDKLYAYNFSDWTETAIGPYAPSDDAGRHRICRSYRIDAGMNGPAGRFPVFAPSDLRLDGHYSERHAVATYWPGMKDRLVPLNAQSCEDANVNFVQGVAAYWIKPGFSPELTQKPRVFFSLGGARKDGTWINLMTGSTYFNPAPFAHAFSPRNRTPNEGKRTYFYGCGFQGGHCRSFEFGYGRQGIAGTGFLATGTTPLNHLYHAENGAYESAVNPLSAQRWVHVAVVWQGDDAKEGSKNTAIYVNGAKVSYDVPGDRYGDIRRQYATSYRDDYGFLNPLRVGEPSVICDGKPYRSRGGNFPADSTIDEFYVWPRRTQGNIDAAINLFRDGRYYKGGDAIFESEAIDLRKGKVRILPPPSLALPTGTAASAQASTSNAGQCRILGVAWTMLAEEYEFSGDGRRPLRPVLMDYQPKTTGLAAVPRKRIPALEVKVSGDDGATWGVGKDGKEFLSDPGWSGIWNREGEGSYVVRDPQKVRYRVRFSTNGDPLNDVYLETPVLDDITIYYVSSDGPQVVAHVVE